MQLLGQVSLDRQRPAVGFHLALRRIVELRALVAVAGVGRVAVRRFERGDNSLELLGGRDVEAVVGRPESSQPVSDAVRVHAGRRDRAAADDPRLRVHPGALDVDDDLGRALGSFVRVIPREIDLHRAGRLPAERAPGAIAVAAAECAFLAGIAVDRTLTHAPDAFVAILRVNALVVEPLDVAVLPFGAADHAERQSIADAEVIGAAHLVTVAAAARQLDVAGIVPTRLFRDQAQCAADRVASKQRTLRPAQNFDPFEVEHVEDRTVSRGVIDVVDIEADARLERGQKVDLPQAADERLVGLRTVAGAAAGHFDIGHRVGDIEHGLNTALL